MGDNHEEPKDHEDSSDSSMEPKDPEDFSMDHCPELEECHEWQDCSDEEQKMKEYARIPGQITNSEKWQKHHEVAQKRREQGKNGHRDCHDGSPKVHAHAEEKRDEKPRTSDLQRAADRFAARKAAAGFEATHGHHGKSHGHHGKSRRLAGVSPVMADLAQRIVNSELPLEF